MSPEAQRLRVHLESSAEAAELIDFLREQDVDSEEETPGVVAVPRPDETSIRLAGLVAAIDNWRSGNGVAEVVLELGSRTTVLRTES